jgi:hypothetical protein
LKGGVLVFEVDRRSCPLVSTENPYNVAIVESLARYRVGDIIEVCADQAVPKVWWREPGGTLNGCPGAQVAEGTATITRIRRES